MPKIHVAGHSFLSVCLLLSMVANARLKGMGHGAGVDGGADFAVRFFFAMVIK
jgi:hypothetical protein